MDAYQYKWKQFPNIGYITTVLSDEQLAPIRKEIDNIQSDFEKHKHQKTVYSLAGQIEHEYQLIDTHNYINDLVMPYLMAHRQEFNVEKFYNVNFVPTELKLVKTWVNYQKKFEYNPVHTHDGIYSFVLYIDIPYLIEDELNAGPGKDSNHKGAGCFQFQFTNSIGRICTEFIKTDKSMNNTLIVFPSAMSHSVSPFITSDKFRISVSGNFVYDNK